MGSTRFHALLEEKKILVADGAMGTTLFSLGMESGGCPEFLNVENPEMVKEVHRRFVKAGSDIILTNTFGGNERRLMLHQATDRVAELNEAGIRIAREAADEADRVVLVAGSVGPTGDLFEPLGPLTHERGVEVFTEQVIAMADAGADLLWAETLSSAEEIAAAYEASTAVDIPLIITMSFDTHGKTMMGFSPGQLGEWSNGCEGNLAGVGANCGIGPGDVVAAVHELTGCTEMPVVAKANCGIPTFVGGELTYPSDPQQMNDYVDLALRSGARIIGACCGSTDEHLALIRALVDDYVAGEKPEVSEIFGRLGDTTTAAGASEVADEATAARRKRSRRRSA